MPKGIIQKGITRVNIQKGTFPQLLIPCEELIESPRFVCHLDKFLLISEAHQSNCPEGNKYNCFQFHFVFLVIAYQGIP